MGFGRDVLVFWVDLGWSGRVMVVEFGGKKEGFYVLMWRLCDVRIM